MKVCVAYRGLSYMDSFKEPSRNVHVFHLGRHRQSRRETGSRSGLLHIDERITGVEGHRRKTGTRTLRVRVDGRVRSDGPRELGDKVPPTRRDARFHDEMRREIQMPYNRITHRLGRHELSVGQFRQKLFEKRRRVFSFPSRVVRARVRCLSPTPRVF